MSPRLKLALQDGGVVLPETGEIVVLYPNADSDLGLLPKERVRVVQPFWPDHAALSLQGFDCTPDVGTLSEAWAASIVFLPRSKALAQNLIALALERTTGPVLIDGDKTDGIESIYRDLRKAGPASQAISKAHGKIFWVRGSDAITSPWESIPPAKIEGFETRPGVFSADGIDPGSALLADALPRKLGRHVTDLGAGWGYLSARALAADPGIETIDLVEADYTALACARANIRDARAHFHWADVPGWQPKEIADCVIMNPPFHQGRKTSTDLGRAFILAAARILKPSGQLFMVANRHLAYEQTLAEAFGTHREIGGDNRFKLLHASKPRVPKRRAS
jgi:16S rRNA (guanine1207-N2)-methyltransferase